jgi:hypothetical protein
MRLQGNLLVATLYSQVKNQDRRFWPAACAGQGLTHVSTALKETFAVIR